MPAYGKLFVFEGPDGVGKSTLAHALVDHLTAAGQPCLYLAFPGRQAGTLGHHVYSLHHEPGSFGIETINPTSLQMLHIAAHIDAIERLILPALKAGTTVVLDRFWWSTAVYGKVFGAHPAALEAAIKAEQIYWNGLLPTAAFLVSRVAPLNDQPANRQWQHLCAAYYELADRQKQTHPVYQVKNDATPDDALRLILAALQATDQNDSQDPPHAKQAVTGTVPNRQGQLRLNWTEETLPRQRTAPQVIAHLSPAEPSEVLDTYWTFAVERQRIFFCQVEQAPPPWTTDPILAHYRFTNAYRASDRVSQYLIRHVIYAGEQTPDELFFRILLFKIFNRIETWELLQTALGEIRYADYIFDRYDAVLNNALQDGTTIFSAAYIMPSGGSAFGYARKHRNYLRLLGKMLADNLPARLHEARSMRQAFDLLRSYPLIGDFLAYQYVIDLNYSPLTNFSEMEFVMPGPGALDGIRKCFRSLGGLNEADIIRFVTDRQADEFARLGLTFRPLWGRPLQLIDCQNLFCEVDKYARLAHPDVKGISNRTRIKRVYEGHHTPIAYWYPPKWHINHLIPTQESTHDPRL